MIDQTAVSVAKRLYRTNQQGKSIVQTVDSMLLEPIADYCGFDLKSPQYKKLRREIIRSVFCVSAGIMNRNQYMAHVLKIIDVDYRDIYIRDRVRDLVNHLISRQYVILALRYFLFSLLSEFKKCIDAQGLEAVDVYTYHSRLLYLRTLTLADDYNIHREDAKKAFAFITQCVHSKTIEAKLFKPTKIETLVSNTSAFSVKAYRGVLDRYARVYPHVARYAKALARKKLRFILMYNKEVSYDDLENDLIIRSLMAHHTIPSSYKDSHVTSYLCRSIKRYTINIIQKYLSKKRAKVITTLDEQGEYHNMSVMVGVTQNQYDAGKTEIDVIDYKIYHSSSKSHYKSEADVLCVTDSEYAKLELKGIIDRYERVYLKAVSEKSSPMLVKAAKDSYDITRCALAYHRGFSEYLRDRDIISQDENNTHLADNTKIQSIFRLSASYNGLRNSRADSLLREMIQAYGQNID